MTAKGAANGSSPYRAIAAFFVLTGRCHALRSKRAAATTEASRPVSGLLLSVDLNVLTPHRRRRRPLLAGGDLPVDEPLRAVGERLVAVVGAIEHLARYPRRRLGTNLLRY
jgi:hypothetical protein